MCEKPFDSHYFAKHAFVIGTLLFVEILETCASCCSLHNTETDLRVGLRSQGNINYIVYLVKISAFQLGVVLVFIAKGGLNQGLAVCVVPGTARLMR